MYFYYTVNTDKFLPLMWPSSGWQTKNANIFIKCRDHFTIKSHIILVKIPVKWYNSDEYKILHVKDYCLWYGSVEVCT